MNFPGNCASRSPVWKRFWKLCKDVEEEARQKKQGKNRNTTTILYYLSRKHATNQWIINLLQFRVIAWISCENLREFDPDFINSVNILTIYQVTSGTFFLLNARIFGRIEKRMNAHELAEEAEKESKTPGENDGWKRYVTGIDRVGGEKVPEIFQKRWGRFLRVIIESWFKALQL